MVLAACAGGGCRGDREDGKTRVTAVAGAAWSDDKAVAGTEGDGGASLQSATTRGRGGSNGDDAATALAEERAGFWDSIA